MIKDETIKEIKSHPIPLVNSYEALEYNFSTIVTLFLGTGEYVGFNYVKIHV